jgi:hypothetical protein
VRAVFAALVIAAGSFARALSVINRAVSVPIPGSPGVSGTLAAMGTARSVEIATTASICSRRPTSRTGSRLVESTAWAASTDLSATAFGSASTATTRWPAALACRIAAS